MDGEDEFINVSPRSSSQRSPSSGAHSNSTHSEFGDMSFVMVDYLKEAMKVNSSKLKKK